MEPIVFALALTASIYAFCFLASKREKQFEAFLDRWYGLPTMLIGGPTALILLSYVFVRLVQSLGAA